MSMPRYAPRRRRNQLGQARWWLWDSRKDSWVSRWWANGEQRRSIWLWKWRARLAARELNAHEWEGSLVTPKQEDIERAVDVLLSWWLMGTTDPDMANWWTTDDAAETAREVVHVVAEALEDK